MTFTKKTSFQEMSQSLKHLSSYKTKTTSSTNNWKFYPNLHTPQNFTQNHDNVHSSNLSNTNHDTLHNHKLKLIHHLQTLLILMDMSFVIIITHKLSLLIKTTYYFHHSYLDHTSTFNSNNTSFFIPKRLFI